MTIPLLLLACFPAVGLVACYVGYVAGRRDGTMQTAARYEALLATTLPPGSKIIIGKDAMGWTKPVPEAL